MTTSLVVVGTGDGSCALADEPEVLESCDAVAAALVADAAGLHAAERRVGSGGAIW
jgi:hypothetical protein